MQCVVCPAPQVIKVEDCSYVKVIKRSMDDLVMLSQWYFGGRSCCSACRRDLSQLSAAGQPVLQCSDCEAAHYCSTECKQRHQEEHRTHCKLCQELLQVLNVDMDRFIQPVPFR